MQTSFPKHKIKVLLLEGIHQNAVDTFKRAGYTQVELLNRALPEAELIEKLKDVRLLGIRSKTQLNARVLKQSPKLLAAACFCIGTNQVDLACATEMGVAIFNSPYSNTRSVAELVIAETVMLMRRVPEKSYAAHHGTWQKSAHQSYEVRGKKLGIVGYGHIGSQVSVLAEAMGMQVYYYDIEPKLPLGNAIAVHSLEELLAMVDVLTLHVPGTPQTKNMIGEKELSLMKKGSYLLNLSRGNVVDIAALKQAVATEQLAGIGIDVYPSEPRKKGDSFDTPLRNLPNTILTPHIGGATQEAQQNIGIDAATKLVNYVDKGVTVGSHSIPEINLPILHNAHRILHVHKNVPGMLMRINEVMANNDVNILGQNLKTNEQVGYVVLDVNKAASKQAIEALREIPHTIKCRILY